MCLLIYSAPPTAITERIYVAKWLFGEVFGIDFEYRARRDGIGEQSLELEGGKGRVSFPDLFFSLADSRWLSADTLPKETLADVDGMPVLYGADAAHQIFTDADLPIDVIGSLFFLMSRYEEVVNAAEDVHQRFPCAASILKSKGLLRRAIGNEYIEFLWNKMVGLWPQLKPFRRQRKFRTMPSHDIDVPAALWRRKSGVAWQCAKLLSRGDVKTARSVVAEYRRYRSLGDTGQWKQDPNDTIDWIMDQSESLDLESSFYYIPQKTSPHDRGMPLKHPHVVDQWRRISGRGHQIGCHPGYETFDRPGRLTQAANLIRLQLKRLNVSQSLLGTRQHCLRWRTAVTATALDAAGFDYDSTLGFAEEPGFRCGLCFEFPMYDVVKRQELRIRQRPLIVMDCSVVDERYLGLGASAQAFDLMSGLKNTCRSFRGDFTILWHNQRFRDGRERELYQQILKA